MATIKQLIEEYHKEVNRYQAKADTYDSPDYKQFLKEDRHVERRLCLSRAHAYRNMIADLELLNLKRIERPYIEDFDDDKFTDGRFSYCYVDNDDNFEDLI